MKQVSLVLTATIATVFLSCTQEINVPPQLVIKGPDVVRVKAPAVFDASGSSDPDGFVDGASFKFDFGDGTEPLKGVSSAAHTFMAKGDFTVTVEVTDDAGAVAKAARLVTVTDNVTPVAKIAGPSLVRKGTEAGFDATASSDDDGRVTGYSFDFGDGTDKVTGVSAATHVFGDCKDGRFPCTYAVSVEVTDNDGARASASIQVTVTDNAPPVASITGPSSGRIGQILSFDASGSDDPDGDVASYSFDFGDSTPTVAGVRTAQHAYAAKGPYTVTLTVTDSDDAKATAAVQVTVSDNVPPAASLKGPATARLGEMVSFDASASTDPDGAIKDYSFDFGDGTAAATGVQTAQHAFPTCPGAVFPCTYSVKVEVTDNDGAKSSASAQITVTGNASPAASIAGPSEARVNQVVTFDASASSDPDGRVAEYSFDFGDGAAAVTGVMTAEHAFATAGPWVVTLEVTDNDGAKSSAAIQILVGANVLPVAEFNAPASAAAGDVVTFDASASNDADGSVVLYDFDFGDGTPKAAGALKIVEHEYSALPQPPATSYTVSLTVTDNDGATGTVTKQITIKSQSSAATPPSALFDAPAAAFVNQAVSVDGSASDPGSGRISAYDWDFGDAGTGAGATAVHTYTAVGVHNIKLTVTSSYKDGSTATSSMTRQISIEDNTVSISSITPNQGSISGGTAVVIKGKGFEPNGMTLAFGGNAALAADVVDSTTLNAVTPSGVPGPADVFLSNANGSVILPDGFTYLGGGNRATTVFCPVLLKTGGTSAGFAANDDDVNLPVALPFDFEFFGRVFAAGSNIRVTTNGWISFSDTGAAFNTFAIPSGSNPADMIAPFFQDLFAGATGQVYHATTGAAPNRQFAIGWRDFTSRAAGGDRYNFEAILYESSNDIKFQYLNTYGGTFAAGSGATAGIQKYGTDGDQAFRNTSTRGLAPGGRVYAFSYEAGAYTRATDATLTAYSSNPPDNGALPTTGSFTVGFSIPVNPSTITGANVQLFNVTTSSAVNANYAVSGDKLTVTGTPASALTIDDRYRVTVTTNVFGANKAQFSQDPAQVACGAVSTPTPFTFEFTAIAGAVQKLNLGGGSTPQGIAVSPTANLAFIAKGNGNRAVSVDINSLSVQNNIALSDCTNPMGVAVTPNGQRAFVTCMNGTGRVSVIDTNGTFVQIDVNGVNPGVQSIAVGSNPDGVAVRPAGDRAYVANSGSNTVSVIDVAAFGVLTSVNVGGTARGAAVNPAGNRLHVANEADDTLSVIDVQNGSPGENTVLQTVDLSGSCSGPRGVAVSPDGSRIYLTCRFDDTVLVLEGSNFSQVATIATGDQPLGIAVSTNGKLAMVAETGANDSVGVLDLDANTYLNQVPAGGGTNPFWAAFKPNSSVGLVTLSGSNELAEVF